MAHTKAQTRVGFSIAGMLHTIGTSLNRTLIRLAEARSRSQRFQYLQSLSDEELMKRGLSRDRIAYYVFADSVWR